MIQHLIQCDNIRTFQDLFQSFAVNLQIVPNIFCPFERGDYFSVSVRVTITLPSDIWTYASIPRQDLHLNGYSFRMYAIKCIIVNIVEGKTLSR